MKDPERLGVSGTEEERRLLRAAQGVRVPDRIQDEVRRTIEARLTRARRRWLFAGAGLLVAATATAAGLPPLLQALRAPPAMTTPPASGPGQHPVIVPLAAAPPPAPPERSARPHPPAAPEVAVHPEPAPEGPRPVQAPELDLEGFRRPAIPTTVPVQRPSSSPRLVITRSDRAEIVLEATATTVRGRVRGATLDLTLRGKQLTGRIGDDAVAINIFGNRLAEGHAGGRDLVFRFTPTEHGWLVDASLPDVGGRVRLETDALSFRPGCDRELRAAADQPGLYEGVCSDDTRVRIWLPTAFDDPLARMVVLGMLLPEPEAELRGRVRGLFPPP
jgi:hypothetical protein